MKRRGWAATSWVLALCAFSAVSATVLLGMWVHAAGASSTIYLPFLSASSAGPPRWTPSRTDTWQWQFQTGAGGPDLTVDADVYSLDMVDTSKATVAALHSTGRRAICYVSVGSWENWRPDAADYPDEILGNPYSGWPGERWVDIRRIDLLGPILRKRLDLCKSKSFDGVEPDNLDGYQANTGFNLTAADQLAINRWIAAEAHVRGLGIGLKNDPDQIPALAADFDWAITEDCFDQGWCGLVQPFLDQGKAAVAIEYTDTGMTLDELCPQASQLGVFALIKRRSLDAMRLACPAVSQP